MIWRYVQNGLNLDLKKFFDDRNHQYQLEIIVVDHNMQNEKKAYEYKTDNGIWRQKINLETSFHRP